MQGTFTLEIELGGDAMRTPHDVAGALARVSAAVHRCAEDGTDVEGRIVDANGNWVGDFEVLPAAAEPTAVEA